MIRQGHIHNIENRADMHGTKGTHDKNILIISVQCVNCFVLNS